MTNREAILKMNTYDLLMKLWLRVHCPIEVLGFPVPECPPDKDYIHADCEKCLQTWLNQETDQPKPQWQDVMMKNFLRKE